MSGGISGSRTGFLRRQFRPRLSNAGNALAAVGKTHPVEPRKIESVLCPEKGTLAKVVIPRP